MRSPIFACSDSPDFRRGLSGRSCTSISSSGSRTDSSSWCNGHWRFSPNVGRYGFFRDKNETQRFRRDAVLPTPPSASPHLSRNKPYEPLLPPVLIRLGNLEIKRVDQRTHRCGSLASLPRDENLPGRAFVSNRNDNDIRCLQVPNETRF